MGGYPRRNRAVRRCQVSAVYLGLALFADGIILGFAYLIYLLTDRDAEMSRR